MKAGGIIYSRYIQNTDGSFDRQRISNSTKPQHKPDTPCSEPEPKPTIKQQCCTKRPSRDISKLFGRLLNRSLDSGDLLILLILVLILQQQQEDSLPVLLTIAFFLFL